MIDIIKCPPLPRINPCIKGLIAVKRRVKVKIMEFVSKIRKEWGVKNFESSVLLE